MKKKRVYTSVPSRYFDENRKEEQRITKLWWKNELPKFEAIISEVAVDEIKLTSDLKKRKNILELIKNIKIVKVTNKAKVLAKEYLKAKIIPEQFENDALHIAIATTNKVDILISWNFKHMVNHETRIKVNGVNLLNGYDGIKIESPYEVGGGKYVR